MNELAQKVFDRISEEVDFNEYSTREIFINAFINGILYGETIQDEDIEIEVYEEQLDLPIH